MSAPRVPALLLLPVAVLLAGCGGGDDASQTETTRVDSSSSALDGMRGAEVAAIDMPDVTLEDTSGQPFNMLTDTTDPITLVFFGYTSCPDVCDLVLSDLTVVMSHLPDDVAAETEVVFVTTDPVRDTPDLIRTYLDRFDPTIVGLTGPMADIRRAARAMRVAIDGKKPLPDGGYDVGHGAQVVGFVHDQAPVVWTEGTPYTAIVSDVTDLARL